MPKEMIEMSSRRLYLKVAVDTKDKRIHELADLEEQAWNYFLPRMRDTVQEYLGTDVKLVVGK